MQWFQEKRLLSRPYIGQLYMTQSGWKEKSHPRSELLTLDTLYYIVQI